MNIELKGRCFTCRKPIVLLYVVEWKVDTLGASWRYRLLNHYPVHEECQGPFRERQRELAGFEARPLVRFNAAT